ncbi:MAG TPA: hypothetical protein VKB34_12625, partial [Povalibacter sp.]|nr:hypothetical protein [Povalibacter sp.]
LDWAYVRFQPVSRLSARAGYMRTPTFMYSDSVFVGYANTWIRPPMEVYNLAPAFQLRGVDLTWRDSIGEVNFSVQPYFGDSKLKIGEAEKTLNIPAWSGIAVSGQYRSFMARAGYASIETDGMDIGLGALIDPLKAAAAAFNCAACAKDAQHLDLDGTVLKILDLGAQYDNGTDIAMVEYGHRSSSSYVIRGMYAAYATYGHRFGNFTPYATYAIARLNGRETSEIPAVGPLAGLSNVVTSTLAERFNNDQDTWSIGLRYEVPAFSVLSGAVAKLQYDSIDAKGGRGLFVAPQPGFDGTAGMISASFDFIF